MLSSEDEQKLIMATAHAWNLNSQEKKKSVLKEKINQWCTGALGDVNSKLPETDTKLN